MRIFYGVCGEGLGHTGRSIAVINELKKLGHEVHIFTFGDAWNYLQGTENLHYVLGLQLVTKNNKVDITGTIKNAYIFKQQIPGIVNQVVKATGDGFTAPRYPTPDLCITDFEPIVPRVAQKLNVPCISIDNQHKFILFPKGLPIKLKLYSFLAGKFIKWFIPNTTQNIITTFHECENCTNLVNIVIRKEIAESKPDNWFHYLSPFVLVYIKEYLEDTIIPVLLQLPEYHFYVYGSTRTENIANLFFKKPSNKEFAQDLTNCESVICTAGNQLIGEAKYFKKPVFAIPLPNQTEQAVNAYYVQTEHMGTSCKINRLTPEKIRTFLRTAYQIKSVPNGLDQIMELLNPYLNP